MDKAAWLIERGRLCIGFGSTKGKLSEKGFIWVAFTSPEALHFETRELAEASIRKNGLQDVVVAEHLFCEQTPEVDDAKSEGDHATIFVLAGCMVDVCINMALKGYPQEARVRTARVIDKAVRVLNRDPSFMKRFQEMQKSVMEEFDRLRTESTEKADPHA